MPQWKPVETWKDQEVFVIGGGASLKDNRFDFNLLRDECTIGCNGAFSLGHEICKICIFGDAKWFTKYRYELKDYQGTLFTNSSQMFKTTIPWLWTIVRESRGLHKNALGWNKNTGASAINLALLLGAKRVFLLGFDMHLTKGKSNWHHYSDKPDPEVYPEFITNFKVVKAHLVKKFPDREVINITDDSDLPYFEKVGVDKFFMERIKNEMCTV